MLEGFEKYNLTAGMAAVSITSNGISFSKTAVVKMNKARYVQLLINRQDKMIAIQESSKEEDGAADFYRGQKTVSARWNNRELLKTIEELMGWQLKGHVYKVDGDYFAEEKTMVFDLKNASVSVSRK